MRDQLRKVYGELAIFIRAGKGVFFILLLGYSVTFILTFLFKHYLWYDEIMLTEIASQDLSSVWQLITTTPHPIGFYLFLKLLPTGNIVLSNLIGLTIYYGLITLVLYYAYKNDIVARGKLSYGMVIYFSSFTHFYSSNQLKHELITIPILLFLFVVTVQYVLSKDDAQKGIIYFVNGIVITLLFIGYIPYLYGLGMLVLITLISRERNATKILLVVQFVVLLSYYKIFLKTQIENNITRMYWIEESVGGFINGLSRFLTGRTFNNLTSYALLTIFIFLIIFYVLKRFKGKHSRFEKYVLLSVVVLIPPLQLGRLFVRTRYSSVLYLLMSILAGWGLVEFRKLLSRRNSVSVFKYLYTTLVVVFFTAGFVYYSAGVVRYKQYRGYLRRTVRETAEVGNVLFIGDHPIEPFVLAKRWHGDNLRSVNIYYPQIYDKYNQITVELLQTLGKRTQDLSKAEIRNRLGTYDTNKIIYLPKVGSDYYDPEQRVLETILDNCNQAGASREYLFVFDNCQF